MRAAVSRPSGARTPQGSPAELRRPEGRTPRSPGPQRRAPRGRAGAPRAEAKPERPTAGPRRPAVPGPAWRRPASARTCRSPEPPAPAGHCAALPPRRSSMALAGGAPARQTRPIERATRRRPASRAPSHREAPSGAGAPPARRRAPDAGAGEWPDQPHFTGGETESRGQAGPQMSLYGSSESQNSSSYNPLLSICPNHSRLSTSPSQGSVKIIHTMPLLCLKRLPHHT